MYTLLNGLYKVYTTKQEFFILIIGLDNAGKTTLLEKIKEIYTGKSMPPELIGPTVGLNVAKIDVGQIRLVCWDLGGQKSLQSLWPKYYDEAHAIVFMVDSTDISRIDQVRETLRTVIQDKTVDGLPVLMLANKQDDPDALKLEDVQKEFNSLAVDLDARDSKVLPVSALTGEGVKEAVEWLAKRIVLNVKAKPPKS